MCMSRQVFARNRISIVAQGHTIAYGVRRNTTGLEHTTERWGSGRRRLFVAACRIRLTRRHQTLLQAAQGYNPFLGKGFCGEPFLPKYSPQPKYPLHTRSIEGGEEEEEVEEEGRKKSRISNIKKVIKSNKSAGKYRSVF